MGWLLTREDRRGVAAGAGLELRIFTSYDGKSLDLTLFFWESCTSLTMGSFLLDGGSSLRQGEGFTDTRLDFVREGVGTATEAARDLGRLELRELPLLAAIAINIASISISQPTTVVVQKMKRKYFCIYLNLIMLTFHW